MAGVPRNEVISAKSPIAFSPSGLILLRVVGLNGFRLNDDSRVTSGERSDPTKDRGRKPKSRKVHAACGILTAMRASALN